MAGIVSKTEVLFLLVLMAIPNTQYTNTRNGANSSWYGRLGAWQWASEYYLVLYINWEKTRVKVPVRAKDGLKDRVVKINMTKYFLRSDTERVWR